MLSTTFTKPDEKNKCDTFHLIDVEQAIPNQIREHIGHTLADVRTTDGAKPVERSNPTHYTKAARCSTDDTKLNKGANRIHYVPKKRCPMPVDVSNRKKAGRGILPSLQYHTRFGGEILGINKSAIVWQ